MEKEAFEPTGLIPRSIIRTVDRFVQQLLPGREKIALQEYRVSRYQILVSIKSLLTLVLIPLLVNLTMKRLVFTPLIEHFWNSRQAEIFLNQYQEKRAFSEMHDFSEKMFFESLLIEPKRRPVVLPKTNNVSWLQSNLPPQPLHRVQNPYEARPLLVEWPSFATPKVLDSICVYNPCSSAVVTQDFVLGGLQSGASRAPTCLVAEPYPPSCVQRYALSVGARKAPLCTQEKGGGFAEAKPHGARQARATTGHAEQGQGVALYAPQESIQNLVDFDNDRYQKLFQKKSLELAKRYNKQSILAITNLLGDFLTFFTLSFLFRLMRPELIILKSFLTESVYSLSDTTKSFLLILGMDLLVGFHSPRGWELVLELFLRHVGLPENENFILLFVALFPVFLDTVFKYWIFRYLNKISPSTVVTYHSMIE